MVDQKKQAVNLWPKKRSAAEVPWNWVSYAKFTAVIEGGSLENHGWIQSWRRGGGDFCHMRTMVLEYESQHLPEQNHPNVESPSHVGKYTSTMEHMG